jgi:hypothetical protein
MPYPETIDKNLLQQWIADKLDPQEVEKVLKEKGTEAGDISEYLKAYKRLKNENRQFIGFICAGLGAFLGFISCVLSIINPIPELYNLILFGLTSLAITIIVVGLYFIFE